MDILKEDVNVDDFEGQNIYLKQYIQKQENMFLDYIRKNIDLEIKVMTLNSVLKDTTSKYEESQKQIELQNDMMQQAAKGLESTAVEKDKYKDKISELEDNVVKVTDNYELRIKNIQNDLNTTKDELIRTKESIGGYQNQYNDIKREFDIQKEELNNLYKENVELKDKLSQKINNKNKKTVSLDNNEF